MKPSAIPVIDLFAGPGGLGEGFSAFSVDSRPAFGVRLSIEKEAVACDTLRLRKFFRAFEEPPKEYAEYTKGDLDRESLFSSYPAEAKAAHSQTWQAELGKTTQSLVYARVRQAIGSAQPWVLLGGPPCQAYSLVGRARMSGRSDFEADERHFLYREYLRIVANQQPTVFVMENVKGLLSAKHGGRSIFERIQDDLRQPGRAVLNRRAYDVVYDLYALAVGRQRNPYGDAGDSFLVRAEEYGIPQNRHRLFIIGVRRGLGARPSRLEHRPAVSVADVLSDLPAIRSQLSREPDSPEAWRDAIQEIRSQAWFRSGLDGRWGDVVKNARATLESTSWPTATGGTYTAYTGRPKAYSRWYRHNASGITLHESRSHMRSDLWRYFFSSCYSAARGTSPALRDFPKELHPAHKNISEAIDGEMFGDRFHVQQADQPASTVTSHIAKDGHYFIHYDTSQCRSLTPREAARIQTFPDSYFFEGSKTDKFRQIGNAVPPFLAKDIASVVHDLLVHAPKRRR